MKKVILFILSFLTFIVQAQDFNLKTQEIFGKATKVLPAAIKQDLVLSNKNAYLIEGLVFVETGKTLTIEQGTTIYAKTDIKNEFGEKTASVVVVKEGAKIIAEGTKEAPIVFTSDKVLVNKAQPSDWIGIQIFGEGGNSNSGIMKYVRIEYAGEELFDAGDAALSLVNLGKNTTIDYVQAYRSGSEGIRVRSGEAILKHLVVTGAKKHSVKFSHLDIVSFDDSFKGGVQFLITYNDIPTKNDDILIRSGSQAVMSNVTLTGAGRKKEYKQDGIRIKGEKTALKIANSIICNYAHEGFEIDEKSLSNTEINEVFLFNNKHNFSVKGTQKMTEKIKGVFQENLAGKINALGFVPSKEVSSSFNPQTLSPNFEKAMYIGAFKDSNPENNWTRGWCLGLNGEIIQ